MFVGRSVGQSVGPRCFSNMEKKQKMNKKLKGEGRGGEGKKRGESERERRKEGMEGLEGKEVRGRIPCLSTKLVICRESIRVRFHCI